MPDVIVDTAAPAPAPPAAVPAASEPAAQPESSNPIERMSFAERQAWEKTGDLPASVTGKPAAAAEPTGDDAPAVDAKTGQQIKDPKTGQFVSKRDQRLNDTIRRGVEEGIAIERTAREAAERRAAELEAKLKPAEPAKPTEPAAAAAEDREPVLEDFLDQPDPYLALQKASVKWEVAQIRKAEAAERAQAEQQTRAQDGLQTLVKTYHERETAFAATVPDFAAKTQAIRAQLNLASPLTIALLDSPVAPQLILHLADHPDDYARIGALGVTNPAAALRELGKLEGKYDRPAAAATASAAPAAKHVTSAPDLGTVLGSQPAPAADPARAAVARGDFSAFDEEETARDLARAGRR